MLTAINCQLCSKLKELSTVSYCLLNLNFQILLIQLDKQAIRRIITLQVSTSCPTLWEFFTPLWPTSTLRLGSSTPS